MVKNGANKGKHVSYETKSNKKNSSLKMFINVILIIVICGILIWIFKDSFSNTFSNLSKTSSTVNSLNNTSHQESISNVSSAKKVENLETVEISNFEMDSYADQTKISIMLNNNSSENIEDLNLNVFLLDESENTVVTTFELYVNKIPANGTKTLTINSKEDLSHVSDIKITK